MSTKLGGAGDRFGDYLCVDCTNLPFVSGRNQLTNLKDSKILKSSECGIRPSLQVRFNIPSEYSGIQQYSARGFESVAAPFSVSTLRSCYIILVAQSLSVIVTLLGRTREHYLSQKAT